jgi:hypothetical protein
MRSSIARRIPHSSANPPMITAMMKPGTMNRLPTVKPSERTRGGITSDATVTNPGSSEARTVARKQLAA